jgi:hypothetical protein
VWADTICINMDDQQERTQQVRMRVDIYRRASRTCVWLGIGDENGTIAASFILQLAFATDIDQIAQSSAFDMQWEAVNWLFCLPWFH